MPEFEEPLFFSVSIFHRPCGISILFAALHQTYKVSVMWE